MTPAVAAALDQLLADYADTTALNGRRHLEHLNTIPNPDTDALGALHAGAFASSAQANAYRFALIALQTAGHPITDGMLRVLAELDANARSYWQKAHP